MHALHTFPLHIRMQGTPGVSGRPGSDGKPGLPGRQGLTGLQGQRGEKGPAVSALCGWVGVGGRDVNCVAFGNAIYSTL